MNRLLQRPRAASAQAGFGLVEMMVGVVIGMIAVLVIFQVYNVAEGFKRNTTAAGTAQQTGLYSAFALGMEIGNAGTGLNAAATDLQWCAPPAPLTGNVKDLGGTYLPIPVLIADGGAGNSDSFAVNYSVASTLVTSVPFTANAGLAQAYHVQSPGGFHPGDLVVGIQTPGTYGTPLNPNCAASTVTAVSAPDANGIVTLTQTGTNLNFTTVSLLFNLGPCNRTQKVQYSVNNAVLLSTPLLNPSNGNLANCGQPAVVPANPVASNVLIMKAQYGINTSGSKQQELDTWVQATVGGGWDPATVLSAPVTTINAIKAVRIGIIIQSEQFDKNLAGFTGGNYNNGDYNWVLFDCPAVNKATCPGRLTGTVPATVNPPGNWRFRKYETVIPLRNVIWNPN
jgi:type IV pilus assembly protein PilW